MKDKKVVWFSPFIYVVPADYENWLEKLASDGWQVEKIGQWDSIRMVFRRGEQKKYRYVYDMQSFMKENYVKTYEEFGWEFVGRMASSCIWRKEYTDIRPESFSDSDSLAKRNKRFIGAVMVSFIMFCIISIIIPVLFVVFFNDLDKGDFIQFGIGAALCFAFTYYLGWVITKIKNRTKNHNDIV